MNSRYKILSLRQFHRISRGLVGEASQLRPPSSLFSDRVVEKASSNDDTPDFIAVFVPLLYLDILLYSSPNEGDHEVAVEWLSMD